MISPTSFPDPMRVLVADDHPMVRAGLAAMVRSEHDMEFVGEAADGAEAVRLAEATKADVALLDLLMPQLDGIEATRRLARLRPQTKVVILTSLLDPAQVRNAIDAGAVAFVVKTASTLEVTAAIRAAHAGRRVLSPEVTDAIIRDRQAPRVGDDLTAREREILDLLALGRNNQDIAQVLSITVPTVKFHVTNLLGKLHAVNRTEAVLTAIKYRLVDAP